MKGGLKMKKRLLIAALSLGVGFMTASPSQAVHKNYDNALTCGNCHTMHNSQGSTDGGNATTNNLGGADGGSLIMLRGSVSTRAEIHKFCLQCHGSNGAQKDNTFGTDNHPAPKVFIASAQGSGNSATPGTLDHFGVIGAGGDFSGELDDSWDDKTPSNFVAQGRGHSLGFTNVIPPGAADGALTNFSCTSCHDPHGAYNTDTAVVNKYRNLRMTPTGSGSTAVDLNDGITSYVGDQTGPNTTDFIPASTGGNSATSNRVWPLYDSITTLSGTPATDVGISNTYAVSTGSATDGISNWCATCHDNWHEGNTSANLDSNGNDWHRHPVDRLLNDGSTTSGAGVTIIDASQYDETDLLKALPVASTNGSGVAYLDTNAEANNKVFCLSCHFAHAGPYYDNLRWDYTSSVGAGTQAGNSIGVGVGCQICHNR